ncbi:hypothetical protein B0T18DRAFT_392176 [Schizothecium vesticola]|uniref:Uncharacterized protein n=1 Tax=Schizothecium vesticola TaxID=314040 RepID=A0AA40EQ11_9PEZI|nr:hypothetical protein B0T18DRAFT_392176 [Schizothecium vesticola]
MVGGYAQTYDLVGGLSLVATGKGQDCALNHLPAYQPHLIQIKPEPVACRRVFPNIPIPDLSDFHALVVEVPEADGKTYAIAVHPRNHPDPGTNGKDAVKEVDRGLHGGTTVVERYWEHQPCAPEAGPFSITVTCIQAVQYKHGLVHEAPKYRPPSVTGTRREPFEKRRNSAESANLTWAIVKRFSPTRLAAKMRRTVGIVGGPDADVSSTTNPFIMDLGKLDFPGRLDWGTSKATAGPSRSAQDRQTMTQTESAAIRARNRLLKVRST